MKRCFDVAERPFAQPRYLRPIGELGKLQTAIRHKITQIDEGKRKEMYLGSLVRVEATLARVFVSGERESACSC